MQGFVIWEIFSRMKETFLTFCKHCGGISQSAVKSSYLLHRQMHSNGGTCEGELLQWGLKTSHGKKRMKYFSFFNLAEKAEGEYAGLNKYIRKESSRTRDWCFCRTCLQHPLREEPLGARLALQTGSFILMSTLNLFCCNLKHFSSYPVLSGYGEQIMPVFSVAMFHAHVHCSRSRHSWASHLGPSQVVWLPQPVLGQVLCLCQGLFFNSGLRFPCHHCHSLSYCEKR